MGKLQKPMIFESKVSADPFERTVQLGNTAERLGAVAEEIEIISTMLKECRLSAQAKTLHSMAEPITVAPCKPTSSWAPADRKALARSRLLNGKDLLRTSAATLGSIRDDPLR